MSTSQRLERLHHRMEEEKLDAFFVTSPANRLYLSGFTGSAGYLYITPTSTVLATDFRYTEQAGLHAPGYEILRITGNLDWFKGLIADSGAKRIGFEGTDVNVTMHAALVKALKDLETKHKLLPTVNLIDQIRAVKEPEELEVLEHAIWIADTAMEQVSDRIQPGMTEKQVAWQMELAMRELGADSISFDTIVAAGTNGARPHHRAGDYIIQKGDPIVIDMGAKYNGYCSDMTRTFVIGEADQKFRKVYDTVLAAQETASATAQAGMTGSEVDGLARKVIDDAGYGEHFGHSLGHGIGLAVHEFPRIGPNSPGPIENGMVFSVEPGIYLTGWGGVRIEDLVVMENGKPRVLNKAHKRDVIPI